MNKQSLIVPKGIRYISDWKEYSLRDYAFPHILNKTLTGCGYTEYCITNGQDLIMCSPRRILLENKESQHLGEVFYARSGIYGPLGYDRDLTVPKKFTGPRFISSQMRAEMEAEEKRKAEERAKAILEFKNSIFQYYQECRARGVPVKILVTYDSFRHVKEALGLHIEEFQVVIDEFQSVLVDAKFKSETELDFLNQLLGLQKVCFVSATPLMDKYLDRLDEFKGLPYYELDWKTEDPGRVIRPEIKVKTYEGSLTAEITKVIDKYQKGKYEVWMVNDEEKGHHEIQSREAVIYVNSVKTICSVIRRNRLTLENTNVLCARTTENTKKIREAFNDSYKKQELTHRVSTKDDPIGSVPRRGEPHKMFTLCTRTVYLGADFYSTNAQTFVFSDANIDCLSVDVSTDLEQILGRQRLDINPWKNTANVWIKLSTALLTKTDFDKELERKVKTTHDLLGSYDYSPTDMRHSLADKYRKDAISSAYKDDYVAVNRHAGSDLLPVFNNLMLIADERTYEIQQIDYKDRFSVYNTMKSEGFIVESSDIGASVDEFECLTRFTDKMMLVVDKEKILSREDYITFLGRIPSEYRNYVEALGTDEIKASGYQRSKIFERWSKLMNIDSKEDLVKFRIYLEFQVGGKYTKAWIKEKLKEIYEESDYHKSPKATDLSNYFELGSYKETNKETGKRDHGFEIIKQL